MPLRFVCRPVGRYPASWLPRWIRLRHRHCDDRAAPWRMMKDAFRSLILFAPEDVTQRIRRLADHEFDRYSYDPTFYNIIQTGRKLWVEIYIRNDTNMINVTQLAAIQKQLSSSLQDIYDDVYVEITPDIKEAAG
ncbi:MAG: hypothetical protein ACLTJG_04465 [[Clostridium] innocuum]